MTVNAKTLGASISSELAREIVRRVTNGMAEVLKQNKQKEKE